MGQLYLNTNTNYGHVARITFEPVFDMDAAFAPAISAMKAKARK